MIGRLRALACMGVCLPLAAGAQVRLDDSASPAARVQPPMVLSERGVPLDQALDAQQSVMHFGRVAYRLATAAYVGRDARIHYVLPAQVTGLRNLAGMRLEWRAGNRLQAGSLRPGERQLVWTGRIEGPWFEDAIDVVARVDLDAMDDALADNFSFRPHFEIEIIR